jgi:hypothetical protein
MSKAAVVEFAKEEEEQRRHRKNRPVTTLLREHFDPEELKAMTPAQKEAAYLKLVRGDVKVGEQLEDRGVLKMAARKTTAQRNKEARRAALENLESKAKRQKKQDKSIGEVGRYLKEIRSTDTEQTQQRAYRKEVHEQEAREIRAGALVKTPRVGRNSFAAAPLEVIWDASERSTVREAAKTSAIRTIADSYYRRNLLEAPPANSRANARRVQKRIRKEKLKNKYVAKEYRDKSLLL